MTDDTCLVWWPNPALNADYIVELGGSVACVCPANGQQDWATVSVRYAPTTHIVEYGAFATLLARYAGRPVTHELVTNEIADALLEAGAAWVEAITRWRPIEGIAVTVTAHRRRDEQL